MRAGMILPFSLMKSLRMAMSLSSTSLIFSAVKRQNLRRRNSPRFCWRPSLPLANLPPFPLPRPRGAGLGMVYVLIEECLPLAWRGLEFSLSLGRGRGRGSRNRLRLRRSFPLLHYLGAGNLGHVARLLLLHHRRRAGRGLFLADDEVAKHGVVDLERRIELGESLVGHLDV